MNAGDYAKIATDYFDYAKYSILAIAFGFVVYNVFQKFRGR